MSKAEDLAEKLYPKKEHVAFGPLPCEEPSVFDNNKPYRIGFIEGYSQAERDLELTWKDIEKVCLIAKEVHQFRGFWSESVYQEVLKRFKERKEK